VETRERDKNIKFQNIWKIRESFYERTELMRTSQFKVCVTDNAYEIDKPTKPGDNESFPMTANRAAKSIIKFPTISKRMASQRFAIIDGK
jgi:hypothetical protein